MMMKKLKFAWIVPFLLCFFLGSISLRAQNSPPPNKYTKWLNDEVRWLITDTETKEFKKLKTDDERDRFIEQFWVRRDPVRSTPENEFKQEYYKRVKHADDTFTYGGIPGSKLIMGKVYIIFGPPKRLERVSEWIYEPMPAWGIQARFKVVFVQMDKIYDLDEEQTDKKVLTIIDDFAKRILAKPSLLFAGTEKKLTLDAGSMEGSALASFEMDNQERKDIPFSCFPFFRKIKGVGTQTTILYEIDESQAQDPLALTLFGRIKPKEGDAEDFKKDIKVKKDNNKYRLFLNFFLKPGETVFYSGIKEPQSARLSLLKREFAVPDFENEELNLSTLILTDKITDAPAEAANAEFTFGNKWAMPKFDSVFKKTDTLYIYYNIYNASIKDEAVFLVEKIQISSDKKNFQIPVRNYNRKIKPDQIVFLWSSLPMSYLEPGNYRLVISVTDSLTNKEVSQEARFKVVE